MLGDPFQGTKHGLFRLCIQICGDLVQQQQLRLCGGGAGDGQKLPLPLRENLLGAEGIIALRQGENRFL